MTDPRIIVAIDTFDLGEANAILDQLDPDLCKIKIGSVVFFSMIPLARPNTFKKISLFIVNSIFHF